MVATFSQLYIPKLAIDDLAMFAVVGRIPNAMLNLVSPTNKILVQNKTCMDPTPTWVLPKAIEGTAKESQCTNKKSIAKNKAVDKEVSKKNVSGKSGNGVSKNASKPISEKSTCVSTKKPTEKVAKVFSNQAVVFMKPKTIKM